MNLRTFTIALTIFAASAAHADWRYEDKLDAMRGMTTRFARLESPDRLQLGFPQQGGSTVSIWLRRMAGKTEVMLTVYRGQFLCLANGSVSVKFDQGSIEQYRCSGASSGSTDVIFLSPAPKFITKLRTAKAVVIEAPFFRAGNRQVTFAPAGLAWEGK